MFQQLKVRFSRANFVRELWAVEIKFSFLKLFLRYVYHHFYWLFST